MVLGSSYDKIKKVIDDHEVVIIKNQRWKQGISSSIRAGINNVENHYSAVTFFIVDQPYLSEDLVKIFVNHPFSDKFKILVTRVKDQICHPICFSSDLFGELKNLKGDVGGRNLFKKYHLELIDWEDEHLLKDIDIESDLETVIQ